MKAKLLFGLIALSLACSTPTTPKTAPKQPSKLTICRSGWTISAGDQPDSTYTGCQG